MKETAAVTLIERQLLEAEGFLELGSPFHALACIEALTPENQQTAQAMVMRIRALLGLRRNDEALATGDQLEAMEPTDGLSWMVLARLALMINGGELCSDRIEKARELDSQVCFPFICGPTCDQFWGE